MTVIDRSVTPIFELSYSVLQDEIEPTVDEVSDGRRHQFVALGQPFQSLPLWINTADVEAAEAVGLVDASKVPDSEILTQSPQWPADSWTRVTPDAPRIPITQAAASLGVSWDTSDALPGVYVISGYTWDPPFNLHSPRWGALKIIDGQAESQNLPAAFLPPNPNNVVYADTNFPVLGCLDALPGSVLRASWAEVRYSGTPQWHVFAEDVPVDTGALDLTFVAPQPPADATDFAVWLQVEVEDPLGRRGVAQTPSPLLILPLPASTDTDTTAGTNSTGEDDSSDTSDSDLIPEAGCGCTSQPTDSQPVAASLWLVMLAISQLRLRARQHARSDTFEPSCSDARGPACHT